MTKPVGTMIIAFGCFLSAAFAAPMGIRPMLAMTRELVKTSNAGAFSDIAQIEAVVILIGFIFPILYAVAGWGLWKLKNWARVLTIILTALAAAFELVRWYLVQHPLTMSDVITTVLFLSFFVVSVFYLLKPGVVSAFLHDS